MSGNASTCVSMMMLLKSSRQRLISVEQKGCIAKKKKKITHLSSRLGLMR